LKRIPGPALASALAWAAKLSSMSCSRRSKSLVSIARTKVSTTAAIVAASPGAIAPSASAEVTAFITAAISAALSIGGSTNLTARSRQAGRTRSMQSLIAVGSPLNASSTALRVKASDSPASSAAAASVVLLQDPVRRRAGLPDRPLSNGRPRTRPGGFGEAPSAIATSFCRRRSAALRCEGLCNAS
jgi:hypothetical protein